jgi:hypothetical protein
MSSVNQVGLSFVARSDLKHNCGDFGGQRRRGFSLTIGHLAWFDQHAPPRFRRGLNVLAV